MIPLGNCIEKKSGILFMHVFSMFVLNRLGTTKVGKGQKHYNDSTYSTKSREKFHILLVTLTKLCKTN